MGPWLKAAALMSLCTAKVETDTFMGEKKEAPDVVFVGKVVRSRLHQVIWIGVYRQASEHTCFVWDNFSWPELLSSS